MGRGLLRPGISTSWPEVQQLAALEVVVQVEPLQAPDVGYEVALRRGIGLPGSSTDWLLVVLTFSRDRWCLGCDWLGGKAMGGRLWV